jgi:hypothetical protein
MSIGNKVALWLLSLLLMGFWWLISPQYIIIPTLAKYKSDFILIFLGWAICLTFSMFIFGLPDKDKR